MYGVVWYIFHDFTGQLKYIRLCVEDYIEFLLHNQVQHWLDRAGLAG